MQIMLLFQHFLSVRSEITLKFVLLLLICLSNDSENLERERDSEKDRETSITFLSFEARQIILTNGKLKMLASMLIYFDIGFIGQSE